MKIYQALSSEHDYEKDDWVTGTVYSINPEIGTFVAVDDQYFGLIPLSECHIRLSVGDSVNVRVVRVREDGKLDPSRERSISSDGCRQRTGHGNDQKLRRGTPIHRQGESCHDRQRAGPQQKCL